DPHRRAGVRQLPDRLCGGDLGGDDGDHPHHHGDPAAAVAQMGAAMSSALQTRAAKRWLDWLIIAVIAVLALGMLLPFLWLFSVSFKPVSEAYKLPPSFVPTNFDLANYA